jgi:hypothetical protein
MHLHVPWPLLPHLQALQFVVPKKSYYNYKFLETKVIKQHWRGIKLPSNRAKVLALAVCPHVSGCRTHPLCHRRSLSGHLQCASPSKLA